MHTYVYREDTYTAFVITGKYKIGGRSLHFIAGTNLRRFNDPVNISTETLSLEVLLSLFCN